VNGDYTAAVEDSTPLLVGIPATNPTHNGCRLRVGPDGDLWIGTGDSLELAGPQDPTSLAGKVLRIDRQTGAPAAGNPFGTPVFTLGHRNVEGLVFRPGTNQAFSIEHGTFRDDEINLLVPGGNYGWDPAGWENEEAAPMTDFDRHPDAIGPVWSSRNPTIATSGGTFLFGDQWGPWNGVLAIACLKATQIHLIWLNDAGHPVTEASAITGFGRLRTPVQGPDGALYIATSNGSGKDRIIRVEPTADPMDDHSGPG
jgi:glucose/arabinose dehydrogenase